MKKVFLFFVFISELVFSQTKGINIDSSQNINEEKIFTIVEEMPQFSGGDAQMFKYISSTIQYPQNAKEMGIQGKVFVSFTIDTTGEIKDIELIKGVSILKDTLEANKNNLNKIALFRKAIDEMNEQALSVVRNMPKWNPGKQNGKAVKVRYTLPISFNLQ